MVKKKTKKPKSGRRNLSKVLRIAAEDYYHATPLVKDQREEILQAKIDEWIALYDAED